MSGHVSSWRVLCSVGRRLEDVASRKSSPSSLFHDDGDIETRSECQFSYMSNSNH
jgi:hypothetical protein